MVFGFLWLGPFLFLLCVFGEGASFWRLFALLAGVFLVLLRRSGG